MNVSRFVVESASYTRATLLGNPSRWLVFILLGLPWMAVSSLFSDSRILEGTTIHWSLIPWRELGLLIGAGLLCNLLISGWIVRLFRNNPLPPDFDHPLLLCLDGIKVHVIPLVWMLVPAVLAFIQLATAGSSTVSIALWPPDPVSSLILVLFAIQLLILFSAVRYGLIGAIRFARTGSVAEAFDLPEIRKTAVRIGLVNYYAGCAIVVLAWILFNLCFRGISLVPWAGPFIALCLGPVPIVFCSRFVAHFCDEEKYAPEAGTGSGRKANTTITGTGWTMVTEYLFWLGTLSILVFLCFTPLILVAGYLGRFLP